MIDTYLFDLDDTIIDASIYSKMYQHLLEEIVNRQGIGHIELQKTITEVKQATGKSRADTYEVCRSLGCLDIYYDVLKGFIRDHARLKFEGIVSVLGKIRASGKRLGVVSGSQVRTVELYLENFNLRGYVDFIVSGNKEDTDFWQVLIRSHGLSPGSTLLVDDDDRNIASAKACGIKTIKVNSSMIEGFSL